MDITTILNSKGSAAAAAAEAQLQQQLAQAAHMEHRTPSEMSSDRGAASHSSDTPLYPPNGQQPLHQLSNLPHEMRYPSPSQTPHGVQMIPNGFMPDALQENGYNQNGTHGNSRPAGEAAAKSFACGTCNKGFARRSDLARHERIHSGVRPHVCEHPGCGKQFIQRSALTVHARVHTGEKPHMCERCGKPFSDSSSLARHRRIHSGKRPYKCPYANCQKTFTRRTTLTRHQNHHTGTIEEAAAETNARLNTNRDKTSRRSDGGYSETGSAHSTPSPAQRPTSMSPANELPPLPNMHYMGNGSIPPHVRGDFQQPSPRSSPGVGSPSLSNFGNSHHRPSLTSHPSGYGPPQPLEPPANNDHRSGSGSPHMTAIGWGSPNHPNMPSPGPVENFAYPEPSYGSGHGLYYPGSNIRRPQSTEPENYEMKPRMGGETWTMPVMQ